MDLEEGELEVYYSISYGNEFLNVYRGSHGEYQISQTKSPRHHEVYTLKEFFDRCEIGEISLVAELKVLQLLEAELELQNEILALIRSKYLHEAKRKMASEAKRRQGNGYR